MGELQTILEIFLVCDYAPDAQGLIRADRVQLCALILLLFLASGIDHCILIILGWDRV